MRRLRNVRDFVSSKQGSEKGLSGFGFFCLSTSHVHQKGDQHMNTQTSANNQATATAREHDTSGSVTSADGTTIGYRQLGHGPGVVLLHGTASSGYNHIQLAEALADAFTVYVPDRRTLGLSGPYSKDYTIPKEAEDVDALLTKTGA